MFSRVILLILGVSLASMSGLLMFSRQQSAESAWLAFMSDRDENWEIYRMRTDGSQIERLTYHDENDMLLGWTDDGQSITFLSWRDGDGKLYRTHMVTGRLEAIPDDPYQMMFPNFGREDQPHSPNNEWVIFSARVGENGEIEPNQTAIQSNLVWSPNGQLIAHANEDVGTWNLFRMRPDGRDLQRLTQHDSVDSGPIWAEDGQEFTYVSNQDGDWDIYQMDDDGSNQRQITNHPAQDLSPVYAPIIDLSVSNVELFLFGLGLTVLSIIRSKYRKEQPEFA